MLNLKLDMSQLKDKSNIFGGIVIIATQTEQNHGESILGTLRVIWCRVYNRLNLLSAVQLSIRVGRE